LKISTLTPAFKGATNTQPNIIKIDISLVNDSLLLPEKRKKLIFLDNQPS